MSHPNYPSHGRFSRETPIGGNSGSSYQEQGRTTLPPLTIAFTENSHPSTPQMDLTDRHQTNDLPAEVLPPDPFFHSIPHQRYNHVLQNAWVPPAPAHGQPEGHREDVPPPVGGVAGPGRMQDPHYIDMAYQGIVDYRPQPLANPAYIFPDGGHAQGIQAQAQPNASVNQGRDLIGHVPQYVVPDPPQATFPQAQAQPNASVNQGRDLIGHVPQHVVPDPPQAAFPHLFVHGIPTPDQPRPEDLRSLASRYWYHPDAQVGMVSVEEGTTGQYKVVITLKTPIGF